MVCGIIYKGNINAIFCDILKIGGFLSVVHETILANQYSFINCPSMRAAPYDPFQQINRHNFGIPFEYQPFQDWSAIDTPGSVKAWGIWWERSIHG
jgi:hypothetical protein